MISPDALPTRGPGSGLDTARPAGIEGGGSVDGSGPTSTHVSSGIGRATARAFLGRGWTVHATARSIDDLEQLRERGCRVHALDVTDGAAVESVDEPSTVALQTSST